MADLGNPKILELYPFLGAPLPKIGGSVFFSTYFQGV